MDRKLILIVLALGIVLFSVGLVIGLYFSDKNPSVKSTTTTETAGGYHQAYTFEEVTALLNERISGENINTYLRNLTSVPHLAGTPTDLSQAKLLADLWLQYGLDDAEVKGYEVLLSYPNKDMPNKVSIVDRSGTVLFSSAVEEPPLVPGLIFHNTVVPPFNAYSASGNPRGRLAYLNYCRTKDFDYVGGLGIDLRNTIIICRYGKLYRGDKVANSEAVGASGLILYGDPADYALNGTDSVYPDTWWLPPTGVQRGTIKKSLNVTGDPLTPGYPANEYAFRIDESEADLPRIPVHPINYMDAKRILEDLSGPLPPDDWKGTLDVEYNIGPGYRNQNEIQLDVYTKNQMAMTYNTIGIIRGAVEPDRYVILGNHRDAWVYGSVDPSGGTASLLELARVFGELLKSGYRPRRSILFCSWGAEEYGLIGSTEWVQENQKMLRERSVAYLNVDIVVQGNATLRGLGAPSLHQVMFNAAKLVPNPNPDEVANGRSTVFDTWLEVLANKHLPDRPHVALPGSASDYRTFAYDTGIPTLDVRYTWDKRRYALSSYPLYHSAYETFHYVDTVLDPTFKYHEAVARLWAQLAHQLASEAILPLDLRDYVSTLRESLKSLRDGYGDLMASNGIQLDDLESALNNFTTSINNFIEKLPNVDKSSILARRMINDQLMLFERGFIDCHGLPGRPYDKHVLFAPSIYNSYSGSTFPGLVDAMHGIETLRGAAAQDRWNLVRKQLAVVVYTIQAAGDTLKQDPL